MLFVNPLPDSEQLTEFYAGADRDQYAVLRYETQFLERDRRLIAEIERFIPAGRLLDLGSSLGTLLFAARERGGWVATGLELSQMAVEHARQKYQVDVRAVPLEEAAFEADAFDCVVASHTLEHLLDPREVCFEINRILRPGGLLYVAVPNIRSLKAKLTGKYWEWILPEHLWYFSCHTLSALLMQTGFVIASVRTKSYRPEAYFYFALLKRLNADRLLVRLFNVRPCQRKDLKARHGSDLDTKEPSRLHPAHGASRANMQGSRAKFERWARVIGRVWPRRVISSLGWGEDLQLFAVKKTR